MLTVPQIGGDKQTVEGWLNTIHSQLKSYTNDQITILDDIVVTIDSFYKTEKYAHEKMQTSLQKSLEHAQNMLYLGSSAIGSSWTATLNELIRHYTEREASYPTLRQIVIENLKKIRNNKVEEHNKVLLYDEEIIKEMVEIERRTIKSKRAYDEACERLRQYLQTSKDTESVVKRLHLKFISKKEAEKLETAVVDTRNLYILQVQQMNHAFKFYIEQSITDIDKLLVCDLFPQIDRALDDLAYGEYKRLRDTIQRAVKAAAADGDQQKQRLLPKTFPNYSLAIAPNQSDQINTEEKYLSQLVSCYLSAVNDSRDADQQYQSASDSTMPSSQNKDSRIDAAKIRLKRMEMRKAMASFFVDTLETLVPNIKTISTDRSSTKAKDAVKTISVTPKLDTASSNASIDPTAVDLIYQNEPLLTQSFPCQAVALYDFQPQHEGEMPLKKDEKVFIESKTEYDGWLLAKGRNQSGFVPEAYVRLISPTVTSSFQAETINSKDSSTNIRKVATMNSSNALKASSSAVYDDADYFSDD